MPEHVLSLIADALNDQSKAMKGSNILLLGVAYKKDVGDIRESPALEVLELLLQRGAHITYHDPFVPMLNSNGKQWTSAALSAALVGRADCVVILTDHSDYNWAWIVKHAKLVVDTRNATRGMRDEKKIYRL
jgi:UDP-N-acetyl-D-glucosamine dehydrogenase